MPTKKFRKVAITPRKRKAVVQQSIKNEPARIKITEGQRATILKG